jgi:hypothetical protein
MAERTDINAIKSDGEPELPDRDESVKPSSGRVHRGAYKLDQDTLMLHTD